MARDRGERTVSWLIARLRGGFRVRSRRRDRQRRRDILRRTRTQRAGIEKKQEVCQVESSAESANGTQPWLLDFHKGKHETSRKALEILTHLRAAFCHLHHA
jgi:hypothetical protein